MRFDLALVGGTIIDGLRTPRFRSDVGVRDGRIARIGSIDPSEADRVIDAAGCVVAPGVVDLHTHYDSQLFWDPWCTMSGWHGVTTVVIGNCGFGFAPCKPEDRERAMLSLSRNEAVPLKTMQQGMPWDWITFPEFLDSVARTPKGVNVMSFVPLAPIYGYVVGLDEAKRRPATDEELGLMCELLREAMEAGGCGFTAQILGEEGNVQLDFDGTPMVTDLMSERDLQAFSGVLRRLRRGVAQVTSAEIATAAVIARHGGQPVIWNTLVADGAIDQHGPPYVEHQRALAELADLNEQQGLRVYAQALTTNFYSEFTFEDYNLADAVPAWKAALLGSVADKKRNLADETHRAALKESHEARGGRFAAGYVLNDIEVHWISSDAPNAATLKETYEGYTIGEVAAREGKHPLDAMLDIAVAGDLKVGFSTPMVETPVDAMREIANGPVSLPGVSDGGAHTKFVTTGRYPTELLAYWSRDKGIMGLEDAHWRLSALPAMAAGLRGRGSLSEGLAADIIVYDLDELDSDPPERRWDYPAGEWRLVRTARGYRHIIVNGEETFTDGECSGRTPGVLLRHGTA
jgi:N-acyl-D-aspartate/D-glutamate deacylase